MCKHWPLLPTGGSAPALHHSPPHTVSRDPPPQVTLVTLLPCRKSFHGSPSPRDGAQTLLPWGLSCPHVPNTAFPAHHPRTPPAHRATPSCLALPTHGGLSCLSAPAASPARMSTHTSSRGRFLFKPQSPAPDSPPPQSCSSLLIPSCVLACLQGSNNSELSSAART